MEPRVVGLETRYSHVEKQLTELNQVMFEQQKSIELLQQQLVAVHTRLSGVGEPMENESRRTTERCSPYCRSVSAESKVRAASSELHR